MLAVAAVEAGIGRSSVRLLAADAVPVGQWDARVLKCRSQSDSNKSDLQRKSVNTLELRIAPRLGITTGSRISDPAFRQ